MKMNVPRKGLALLCLFLFCSGYFIGQGWVTESSWIQSSESVFDHVDMTQIPSGLLYEKALPFSKMKNYNGQLNDSNFVEETQFQLIAAHIAACGVSTNSAWIAPDALHAGHSGGADIPLSNFRGNFIDILDNFYSSYADISHSKSTRPVTKKLIVQKL
jgi:hypothetical protein